MRIALIIEYDGTRYHGFQYQKNASSIQEELEKSIYKLEKKVIRIKGSGRTDAGVHSLGQWYHLILIQNILRKFF